MGDAPPHLRPPYPLFWITKKMPMCPRYEWVTTMCEHKIGLARLSIIISFAPPREGIFRRHLTIYSAAVDQLMRDYCYELEMFLLFIGIDTIFYLHIT